MVLTVLDDDQVRGLLENLDADELARFRQVLNTALFEFSTDVQADEDGLYQQPHRTTTCHRQSQAMTLYMPSSCPQGMGCKGKKALDVSLRKFCFAAVLPHQTLLTPSRSCLPNRA